VDHAGGTDPTPVVDRGLQGAAVEFDGDDAGRRAEGRPEGEHPGARPEVDDGSPLDVALEVRQVDDVGGQRRRRRILLEGRPRAVEARDDRQLALEFALATHGDHPATRSTGVRPCSARRLAGRRRLGSDVIGRAYVGY
jgi:hypothetical protein